MQDAALAGLHDPDALCRSAQVTDKGIQCLCALKGLRRLDLGGCGRVSDAGMASLTGLPSLTDISIKYCVGITDRALVKLKNKLPNIKISRGV